MAPRTAKPINEALGDIDEQIAKLNQKKRDLVKKRSERIARIVSDSGLAEIDIDDDELLAALKELASRFQGKTASQAHAAVAQNARPDQSAGQSQEEST